MTHAFPRAVGIALLAAGLASAATATTLQSMSYSQGERNGVCMFGVKGGPAPGTDQPMALEFTYRVSDGNMGASIKVNGWERAQNADPDKNVPMTLVFETGKSAASRSGGYSSGFSDSAWGGWGAGPASDAILAQLKTAKTVRVKFDGMELGPFDLQLKSLGYNVLNSCAEQVRAKG